MKKLLENIPGYDYFGQVIATATFKQSSITFFGTVLNGLFGAVFYILTARFLGPEGFGLMSVAITVQTLVSDVGDLGTDTGLVNFVSRYLSKDPEKAKRFLKLGLKVKILVSFAVLALGLIFSSMLAKYAFQKPELAIPLKIAFVGVGTLLLFSFITRTLQAMQKFWAWSNIQIVTNFLRVIFILLFLIFGILNLTSSLWLYITMPLIGFTLGIFIITPGFLKVRKENNVAREFFSYNKWVAGFAVLAAFGARMDTFISARLLTTYDLGLYSAAYQLVKIVPQIVSAIGTVISPKMASMSGIKELIKYLKKTQIMVSVLAILGLLSIPLVVWVIPYIFGAEYVASGPLFIILLFAMLAFLISVPIHMSVFYYFSYPQLFFWLSLAHLMLTAILGWYLISILGITGAAITVLIGQIFNFLIPLVWVLRKIKSEKLFNT